MFVKGGPHVCHLPSGESGMWCRLQRSSDPCSTAAAPTWTLSHPVGPFDGNGVGNDRGAGRCYG